MACHDSCTVFEELIIECEFRQPLKLRQPTTSKFSREFHSSNIELEKINFWCLKLDEIIQLVDKFGSIFVTNFLESHLLIQMSFRVQFELKSLELFVHQEECRYLKLIFIK